ncbi:MAG: HAMP domain-containing sensor histidine kinase [Rhodopila sp.]|nr:HAMP domain-containing sensor histidine kinase [Rhodopila sp.]
MNSSEASPPSGATSEELQQRIAELAEAVAARDTFIAIAAHELRNPMTPMLGQVDLLLQGIRVGKYSPEQIEQRLERIRHVMSHYVKRAAVLLNVSRITSGKLTLEPVGCDLSDLVRGIAETFAEPARHAGSPIGLDVPASLPGTWDPLAMEQIIDNLVSNAIKYGGRRPVDVRVEAFGDSVHISVRDHGPGISAESRARIFARFERAIGTEESRSGFGVGLWVVGQLVEAMEGTITVDNAPDGGAVFTVAVPRHGEGTRS